MSEGQAATGQHVAALQAELAAAYDQAASAQSALEAAARDASQVMATQGWSMRQTGLRFLNYLPAAPVHGNTWPEVLLLVYLSGSARVCACLSMCHMRPTLL